MRNLPLFVCLCALAIFGTGAVRSEETSNDTPAAAAAAAGSTNPAEQSRPPAAAAKPVVERSRREICDTLVQSAKSHHPPVAPGKRLQARRGEPRRRTRDRAIHAGDGEVRGSRQSVRSSAGYRCLGTVVARSCDEVRQSRFGGRCVQCRSAPHQRLAGQERQIAAGDAALREDDYRTSGGNVEGQTGAEYRTELG